MFYFLLEFLRTGQLRSELPDDMVLALATEAEHFGVQALQTLLKHKRVVVRESLWSHRRELLGPHYNGICSIVLDKVCLCIFTFFSNLSFHFLLTLFDGRGQRQQPRPWILRGAASARTLQIRRSS